MGCSTACTCSSFRLSATASTCSTGPRPQVRDGRDAPVRERCGVPGLSRLKTGYRAGGVRWPPVALLWLLVFPGAANAAPRGRATMLEHRATTTSARASCACSTPPRVTACAPLARRRPRLRRQRRTRSATSTDFSFAAPAGRRRSCPACTRARRASRTTRLPGIMISGDGRACGNGPIRQLRAARARAGRQRAPSTRAWVIYEYHCGPSRTPMFGELRVGAPAPSGPRTAAERGALPGGRRRDRRGTRSRCARSPIERAEVIGDAAADFVVRHRECSTVCDVWVRFVPTRARVRGSRGCA